MFTLGETRRGEICKTLRRGKERNWKVSSCWRGKERIWAASPCWRRKERAQIVETIEKRIKKENDLRGWRDTGYGDRENCINAENQDDTFTQNDYIRGKFRCFIWLGWGPCFARRGSWCFTRYDCKPENEKDSDSDYARSAGRISSYKIKQFKPTPIVPKGWKHWWWRITEVRRDTSYKEQEKDWVCTKSSQQFHWKSWKNQTIHCTTIDWG